MVPSRARARSARRLRVQAWGLGGVSDGITYCVGTQMGGGRVDARGDARVSASPRLMMDIVLHEERCSGCTELDAAVGSARARAVHWHRI